jgi:7-alpha-hydroxysteroid dehydrogenase
MSLSVSGKTAIVTGAANGLGLAIARHLVDKGAKVMFADIDEARLEAEVGEDDLREKLTIANLLSATVDAFDRVDIVVNASRRCAPSEPLDPESDGVEMLWQQNVMTSLRVSQMAARRMLAAAEKAGVEPGTPIGAIVNISSLAATRAQPGLLGYAIASAAVEQMTRSLALELAGRGIRVNAVSFGSVMTASLQGALRETPGWRDAIEAGTPMGRIAGPDELAETVQFLASDAARFLTGQVITVDGGRGLLDRVAAPAF